MPPELYPAPNSNAHILAPIDTLDFYCLQSIELPKHITPQDAWTLSMSHRTPILNLAFKIRDAISSLFGVAKIHGFTASDGNAVSVGDKLDFFLVEHTSNDVLTLSERASHLDVITCLSSQGKTLSITSSVKTHNWFGKLYMIPVAPAHKLIVCVILRRIKRSLLNSA